MPSMTPQHSSPLLPPMVTQSASCGDGSDCGTFLLVFSLSCVCRCVGVFVTLTVRVHCCVVPVNCTPISADFVKRVCTCELPDFVTIAVAFHSLSSECLGVAGTKRQMTEMLFVVNQDGTLVQYSLEPRPKVVACPMEKVSEDAPVELVVTGQLQWMLSRWGYVYCGVPRGVSHNAIFTYLCLMEILILIRHCVLF